MAQDESTGSSTGSSMESSTGSEFERACRHRAETAQWLLNTVGEAVLHALLLALLVALVGTFWLGPLGLLLAVIVFVCAAALSLGRADVPGRLRSPGREDADQR